MKWLIIFATSTLFTRFRQLRPTRIPISTDPRKTQFCLLEILFSIVLMNDCVLYHRSVTHFVLHKCYLWLQIPFKFSIDVLGI